MENLTTVQKMFLFILGIIVVIILLVYVFTKDNSTNYIENEITEDTQIAENAQTENIIVHVAGQVENEGIIELKPDARLNDAIEAAGGLTAEADLTSINLATQIKDGQKIYIPSKDEIEEGYIANETGQNGLKEVGKVNINTATQTELETLSGIGASTALKIINYRINSFVNQN